MYNMRMIRYFMFSVVLTCMLTTMLAVPAKAQSSVITNYISKYKTLATTLSEQYGIPVAIILGVAIVESSAGRGPAVKNLNNHFGIEGKNTLVLRGKHKSRYKEYECGEQSYEDFCKMIARKRFYEKVKNTDDPKKWVEAMSNAHYSEIPEAWKKKILTAIRLYHLETF